MCIRDRDREADIEILMAMPYPPFIFLYCSFVSIIEERVLLFNPIIKFPSHHPLRKGRKGKIIIVSQVLFLQIQALLLLMDAHFFIYKFACNPTQSILDPERVKKDVYKRQVLLSGTQAGR